MTGRPIASRTFAKPTSVVNVPSGTIRAEAKLPPAWKMARNLAGSVARSVASALAGQKVVATDEEQERRHDICRTNACGRYAATSDRCLDCGCFMRAKVWLHAERCKLGHW